MNFLQTQAMDLKKNMEIECRNKNMFNTTVLISEIVSDRCNLIKIKRLNLRPLDWDIIFFLAISWF